MDITIGIVASLIAGFLASLGIGGGSILLVYLTVIAGTAQLQAQGINLIFFIPIAIIALIIHFKNRLIEFKKIWILILIGLGGAVLGSIIADYIPFVQTIFAVGILLLGVREIFAKNKKNAKNKS